jgi:hypothetical protein
VSRGLTLGNVNNGAGDVIARAELHENVHYSAMPPRGGKQASPAK